MTIQEHYSLKNYNTFGVEAFADYFVEVSTFTELKKALLFRRQHDLPILFIGGGSNMLFVNDFKGLALKLNLSGIEIVQETDEHVWVKAQGSENWHEFIQWTLAKDFGGLENLSLIPGNVGTAPIQNIGAYGVEAKDSITEVHALALDTGDERLFSNEECAFSYRESVFKNKYKGDYVIVAVTFKLTKHTHILHLDYGAIRQELGANTTPTIQQISEAVIHIRQSKLPDPAKIGNSGSFFKNPIVDMKTFEKIYALHPTMAHYPMGDQVKIAAGWLIEQAGWKGKRFGDAGVHDKQALVLVNHGKATGREIYDLSENIIADIYAKFGVRIEREVNMIL